MATIKQKRLAKNIVKNVEEKRWDKLEDLVKDSGYALNSAQHDAKALIQNKGVQECLVSFGFTETAAKAVVAEILLIGTESNRLRAAQEVFKVTGSYAPEKSINLSGNLMEVIDKLDKRKSLIN